MVNSSDDDPAVHGFGMQSYQRKVTVKTRAPRTASTARLAQGSMHPQRPTMPIGCPISSVSLHSTLQAVSDNKMFLHASTFACRPLMEPGAAKSLQEAGMGHSPWLTAKIMPCLDALYQVDKVLSLYVQLL